MCVIKPFNIQFFQSTIALIFVTQSFTYQLHCPLHFLCQHFAYPFNCQIKHKFHFSPFLCRYKTEELSKFESMEEPDVRTRQLPTANRLTRVSTPKFESIPEELRIISTDHRQPLFQSPFVSCLSFSFGSWALLCLSMASRSQWSHCRLSCSSFDINVWDWPWLLLLKDTRNKLRAEREESCWWVLELCKIHTHS